MWMATGLWRTVVNLPLLSCFVPLCGSRWGPSSLSSMCCGGTSECSPSASRMLIDGFRSIPVAVVSYGFLRMNWCISSHPFALTSLWPFRFFPRVMAPVSVILHDLGIRILGYLFPWLALASSRVGTLWTRDKVLLT